MAKLGEVCTIVSGSTPKTSVTSYWDGNIKWITPAELNEDTFYIMDSVRHITEEGKEKTGLSYLPTGTVILSSRAPIGKTAIAGCKMCCNQGFKNLICSDAIYNEYLYFFLKSKTDYLNSLGRGATFKEISKSIVENIEIPLPEVNQQKEIAEKFKKLEQLISLRKQQLAKLDELIKARFVEMFGDPVKNTMDWEIKPLSELGELNRGVSKARPRNSPELLGGPYPLIQTGEVANAKTYITSFNSTYSEKGLAQSKMWPKGTLCITIAANIAQTSILTFDACFPDSVVGFISRNMTNELFIHYWFSFFQKILDEQAPQVAQKNINLKILSELNVIVPPLSLQNRFAAFVERVDQQKQTIQQSLEKLELMKKALMQEYFG